MCKPYEKAIPDIYDFLRDKMKLAVENAKIIHQRHNRNGGVPSSWNSCTTVYELAEELLKWKI